MSRLFTLVIVSYFFVNIFLSALLAQSTKEEQLEDFANHLIETLIKNDTQQFKKLHSAESLNDAQDYLRYQAYVFECKQWGCIAQNMKKQYNELKIETYIDPDNNNKGWVIYINSDKFAKNPPSHKEISKNFNRHYFETPVRYENKEWHIPYPGFYFSQHAPWAGEYGR